MIAYQDFVPKAVTRSRWGFKPEFQPLAAAVAEANKWIEKNKVKVIHIETVILPNIPTFNLRSTAALLMGGNSWHQFVRVWYEKDE